MDLLIIGGSDAGISAALRAKELMPSANVSIAVADGFPNFSICGLPFYLSGEVADWRSLAHRTIDEIESKGIRLLLRHRAQTVDPKQRTVAVTDHTGRRSRLTYDRLVIGTGAASVRPPINGIETPGVFFLRWMADSFSVDRYLNDKQPKSAVLIGGGYIGMEMADALTLRGIKVTVVEFADTVLGTVTPVFGKMLQEELERHQIQVVTNTTVESITVRNGAMIIKGSNQFEISTDMVLVAVGSRPETALARSAGCRTGLNGALTVDRHMRTNVQDIFAAGDCVETWHRILQKPTYLPLGTTAHKQGRIAGENAVGGDAAFEGSLGTQAVKIFDLVVARTGLGEREAKMAGFDPFTASLETWDHKVYYPNARLMTIRIIGDRPTGRCLGAQILGRHGTEVSKRIDIIATAIYNDSKVSDLVHLDLSYTPPLSSPWDPVQMCAQAWLREQERGSGAPG